MLRVLPFVLGLLILLGCAKPDLPHTPVRAATAEEFAACRAELVDRHGAAALAPFDTAVQELQLAAMDQFPSAADRAAAMRRSIDGRTVREAEIRGWQARHARLHAESVPLEKTLEQDLRTQAQRGTDTSTTVLNRIQNVQDILAKLRRLRAEAEQQLAHWGAQP